jgi:hypothetical protein
MASSRRVSKLMEGREMKKSEVLKPIKRLQIEYDYHTRLVNLIFDGRFIVNLVDTPAKAVKDIDRVIRALEMMKEHYNGKEL